MTATRALKSYWADTDICRVVNENGEIIREWFEVMASKYPSVGMKLRGKGMIYGLSVFSVQSTDSDHLSRPDELSLHRRIARRAFESGLIIETAGAGDEVLKLLPPLLIDDESLREGLEMLENSIIQTVDVALENKVLEEG